MSADAPFSRRALLFVYSTKNLVGSSLALLALAMYFGGVIHEWWLGIVAGAYAIGALGAPGNPALETSLNSEMDSHNIAGALDGLVTSVRSRTTPEIANLVDSIRQSILTILPALSKPENQSDPNIFVIRQTALDYLPETLQSYLRLPPAYRNTYPVTDGKTATQLLLDQLTMLDAKMKDIVRGVLANDTAALVANGEFLREKFKPQTFLTPV